MRIVVVAVGRVKPPFVDDVAHYEGKITLITIGLGEAAIAANQCVARARGVKLQPAYSTE